jgi:hypothetical protein
LAFFTEKAANRPARGSFELIKVNQGEDMRPTRFDRAGGRPELAIFVDPGPDGVAFEGGQDDANATKSD